ncbi:MAG: NADH-quinone oxidoreductase subunit D [Acidimicrobiia bacterium]|jgi:NADH-quinone oxidoreductase subunit D|nr:NADH-quinone oxidoreductase subunit D [Acidimicrobiia bacterium]MBP8180640.1 NADH-quinone oxidoreductase subunit D [Acidimicrobiia bacterium]
MSALEHLTDEGRQKLPLEPTEREIVVTGTNWPGSEFDDDPMIINMGPQHPSTHGVLRLMCQLEGETVTRVKPIIGYLHTGMEKTGEELTYVQGATNVTRMDYASCFFNEVAFCSAAEALLDLQLPPRARWIRMLMMELNRISSHLLSLATGGMDIGGLSAMIFGFREREYLLRFFEKVTGLRFNHNFFRVGGSAADLPDGWQEDVEKLLVEIPKGMDDLDQLLTENPIWLERMVGVGMIDKELAVNLGASGLVLRSTGVDWDLRRDMPYLAYDQVEFDVISATNGDCYDRFRIRMAEIYESLRIVKQCVESMPEGDYRVQDRKITPPPRARIDESMEALIHHFKLFTEGFKVPAGQVYSAVESPRGELGCMMVADGGAKPIRMHMRTPSFYNLQTLEPMMVGGMIADAVAVISGIDPVMGDVDR